MEEQTGVWLLAALLVAALISAEAQNKPSHFEVGGELVLEPKPVSGPITSIVWKFRGGIVGEWAKGTQALEYGPKYQGRANVDTSTGVLTISKMTKADIGPYTVEINNKEQDGGYDAIAIKQVPKPQVTVRPESCDQDSKSCVLSCEGDTEGAEPVTFYFKKGDGEWKEGEQNITITEDTRDVEKFSCRIKNPLGEKESDPVKNPFYNAPLSSGAIAGIVVGFLVAVVAVVVGGGIYLKKKKSDNSGDLTRAASPPTNNGTNLEGTPLNDTNNGSPQPV